MLIIQVTFILFILVNISINIKFTGKLFRRTWQHTAVFQSVKLYPMTKLSLQACISCNVQSLIHRCNTKSPQYILSQQGEIRKQ